MMIATHLASGQVVQAEENEGDDQNFNQLGTVNTWESLVSEVNEDDGEEDPNDVPYAEITHEGSSESETTHTSAELSETESNDPNNQFNQPSQQIATRSAIDGESASTASTTESEDNPTQNISGESDDDEVNQSQNISGESDEDEVNQNQSSHGESNGTVDDSFTTDTHFDSIPLVDEEEQDNPSVIVEVDLNQTQVKQEAEKYLNQLRGEMWDINPFFHGLKLQDYCAQHFDIHTKEDYINHFIWDLDTEKMAILRAIEMNTEQKLSHTRPYGNLSTLESIAWGYDVKSAILNGWGHSELEALNDANGFFSYGGGHLRHLLDPNYRFQALGSAGSFLAYLSNKNASKNEGTHLNGKFNTKVNVRTTDNGDLTNWFDDINVKSNIENNEITVGQTGSVSLNFRGSTLKTNWTVSNPDLASVSVGSDGVLHIEGKKAGKLTISVKIGDHTYSYDLTIKDKPNDDGDEDTPEDDTPGDDTPGDDTPGDGESGDDDSEDGDAGDGESGDDDSEDGDAGNDGEHHPNDCKCGNHFYRRLRGGSSRGRGRRIRTRVNRRNRSRFVSRPYRRYKAAEQNVYYSSNNEYLASNTAEVANVKELPNTGELDSYTLFAAGAIAALAGAGLISYKKEEE